METHRALLLALMVAALGCEAAAESSSPPTSNLAALCGSNRSGSTMPEATSSLDGAGAPRWFAIRSLNLGFDALLTGKRTSDAWRCYGFDLDPPSYDAQSKASAGSCKRALGATSTVMTDGVDGIDNNFGRFTAHALQALDPCLDPARDEAAYQLLLRLDGDPTKDASHVVGSLYLGRPYDAVPVHASVRIDSLQPVAVFPAGYVADGFWMSGNAAGAQLDLPLTVGFQILPVEHGQDGARCAPTAELRLPITKLLLSIKIEGGAGMLGGTMPVASLRAAIDTWLGQSGVCPATTLGQQVTSLFTTPADLALDPGATASSTCDAVSLGLGFTATPVETPPLLLPLAPLASTASSDCASE